jgi:hypothetical protein
MRNPDAVFVEEQPLRDNPLLYLAFAGGAGMIGFFLYVMYRQLILGEPWGDRPMNDTALAIVGGLYILLGLLLLFLFFRGRLVTEVRTSGVFVRYFPFHRSFRHIPLEGVRSCEARTYSPIREYGGWGIRMAPHKRAYNVSGNRGVELEYEDGKKLLIGSKKAEQLASAVESIRR